VSSIVLGGPFFGKTLFDDADDSDFHKDLIFTGAQLSQVDIYEDAALTVKLFEQALTFNAAGQLITVVLTRLEDSATATKTLAYLPDGKLDTVIIS
jgi:hypothetical protein